MQTKPMKYDNTDTTEVTELHNIEFLNIQIRFIRPLGM